ncbi:MAG: cyclic nucleotide-binding domain-containing protein [Clostridia bacterium]|jgi:CRP-like cAMP-binding protein|nr:cyclic nucleotide-binding domain-containing protein [Clostridia bacterium]
MEKKVFKKNEVVFREGEFGKSFFQIVEGTAGIYLHYGEEGQRKLTDMTAGQFFGEMAVIEAWPRSATVVAEDELQVIEIEESNLNQYFKEQPDKILALMKQIGNRIRSLTEEYDEVNAFIKEKNEAGAEKKEGFFAKLKKYREISILASKNVGSTLEDVMAMKEFGQKEKTPLQVMSFKKGQIIFREGDTGNYMYAVHSGTVGIYVNYGAREETKLTTLYADSFFGEMSLISDEPRSATAVIEENDTTLEIIRADDLEALFEANPLKIDMILTHLSNRLRRLTKDYAKACAIAVEGT